MTLVVTEFIFSSFVDTFKHTELMTTDEEELDSHHEVPR